MEQEKREQEWGQLEEWLKEELEKAKKRFLLAESFDEIEEVAVGLGQAFEKELMAAGASQQEIESKYRICPECGARMARNGQVSRQMKTSRGEVGFKRARWICSECRANSFPPR